MLLTKELVETMPYPDFVGLVNQWNVLPGAHTTLSKWRIFSNMNENSNILQVACTTGFQSREIANITGCSGKAFDLSEYAVSSAKYNAEHYSPEIKIEYFVQDGLLYETDERFSHIMVGAGLGFFPYPNKMLEKCISLLEDGGYILASPFYAINKVPDSLIEQCKNVFGIHITTDTYENTMQMYKNLEIIFQDKNVLFPESESDIEYYCKCITNAACERLACNELYDSIYMRLKFIKDTTNELRKYQQYTVLVLRYRKSLYPNRFIELY